MSVKSWNITRMSTSPRLIPEWKDLKLLINNILKYVKVVGKPKNDVVVLSDWPETLYQEPYNPKNKPFICFYSTNVNYFVSLNWMEPYSKQMQVILWIQKKDTEMKGMIEKMKFHLTAQVPPIKAMVHTGSYHMLIAYCGDMHLWLFGDHHQAFTFLGTVPCHFFISCLCYDPKTEILLSGTLGAVVTWFILPNGRGLQMAQTVSMPGHELVQGFSLNSPQGSLLALSENTVRVFTLLGQGQLIEVKKFTPIASGSPITCSFACVSQGYFYAGNRDGEVHAWCLDRGNFLHRFQAHSSSVICIYSRPETHTLLTAGSEGVVREWNLAFGNLLRQLDIDEDLWHLQFIDNTTFFCQTTHTFSLYSLPYFYSLFNVCGSAPRQVQRVCCGRNWTRILCATRDGLFRFLSPVTGDLLVITWPLLVVDKAVTWAYDSDREELFVATNSSKVLVFDVTRSPCTAKYLVCTSVNPEDRVRCLAYGKSYLGKGLVGLMFCGHDSGIVRILSHYTCARTEKTVHSGAVLALSTLEGPQENSLLCSYGIDNIVQLTEAVLQENKVILQPVSKILCSCVLKHVILLPRCVGAITEKNRWRLWHYQDFPTSSESKQRYMFKETKCLHQCAITSFDVCLSLNLFVTGGTDGSVRIWDFHGRLISELDSSLHFGPLCFANNRGDLLLTFNQSLYLVSCLKLLPPAQLIHLAMLNNADEIHEVPRPFLPSFFFSFEIVFVPKFVYLGQGLQELQGLEALVNKRVIAFDNTVPHVVEEERCISSVIEKEPELHFLEDKGIDSSTLDPKHSRPSHLIPAQLRLAGWDGLNPYHILRCFFGHGQQWPFAPDGYIPNSVVRARLWPEGTPIFLLRDLYPPSRGEDWDETELFRWQALSPMSPVKEQISKSKQDKSKKWKQTLFDILAHLTNLNWIGRKLDERLINNLIEAILNLTVYCSVEQYKIYISALVHIFATCQICSSLCSETACRLLEDTTHSNPQIRKLAWDGLERLGFLSPLFAIPLAVGLMDRDKNVRAKALYLMLRVTGIQTKTMLVSLLKKQETFQYLQQEFIGDTSLDQLLGIRANDMQYLLSQVERQLNENLMLSHTPLSKPGKITQLKKRMTHVQAKGRKIIKKDLRVSKMEEQLEFVSFSSVSMPSKDEGEQREARISEQIDIQDVTLEPELPLRTSGPVEYQEGAESKETMLDAKEALDVTEAVEATKFTKAIDQYGMKDYEEVIPKLELRKYIKKLWKGAMKKSQGKAYVKLKEKKDMKDISKTAEEEPMEEVIMITEQIDDTRKKLEKRGHGLAGTPGRIDRTYIRRWRSDICSLATSRIASFHPEMIRDLGQELVDFAQVTLTPQHPSWDIFQEMCPLLKGSSELYHEAVEEPPVITEKMTEEDFNEEETVGLRKQRGKVLKKGKAFSQVKKKKTAFLESHLVLDKNKFKNKLRKRARQGGKIAVGEGKVSKPKKKLIQEKEKLTKDKVTHQTEKTAWEGEIPASSQKKLTRGEQKLVLREKRRTRKEGKVLGERKRVTWKEKKAIPGRRKWDWEETMLAQEEGMWTQEEGLPIWKDRKLSQEEEKAGREEELGEGEKQGEGEEEELSEREEEELSEREEEKLYEGEEEPGEGEEEKLHEGEEESSEEEDLGEEEEELAWYEEELILDIENQEREKKPYKKKKHILGMEKHVEEEAWERGKLAHKKEHLFRKQERLSGEGERWALKGVSLVQRMIKLTREREKWLEKEKKEAHKRKQIQEKTRQVGSQEKEEQKERQAKKDEKEAKGKQLVSERKKLGLGEETFGEAKILSQEDKQAPPKTEKAWEKEKKGQKQEITTQKKSQEAWGKQKVDLREEGQAGAMGKRSQKEKQAWGEMKQDQREEKLAGKVEKEVGEMGKRSQKEKQAWGKRKQDQREEKLAGKVEKEAGEMGKWSQKEKQAWGKKQDQREEKLAGKVEKEAGEMGKWSQKEKQAWGKKQDQREEKLAGKVEKEAGEMGKWSQKEKQAWGKKQDQREEKLAGKVEKEAGEMGKWSQKEKKQARGKKKQDQREEKLAGKVKKEAEENKRWTTEKMKLVPEEKKRKEIGKVSPQKEKQVMKKEAEVKKEEKWIGRGKKATEEKKHWTSERGKPALQEEKQARKERIRRQKEEKDSEQKEQWAWEKEKLSLEEKEQASEMKKKSQEKEERALEERLTQKDSKLAKEERHISKKEKEMIREGIGIKKQRKNITEEEEEIMKKEGKLFQEERPLMYDRTTEMGVAEREKEGTRGETIQAIRELDMGRGISSEEKDAGFKGKDLRKKVKRLLRILAKTIRRISTVPLEEIKVIEEERSSIMERSEIDGQKWEFFQEQKEITKEELDQKERKLEEGRLTDEESLEEDQRLLEKVQETILDKIQVESILKEIQEENLLGKMQLKTLLERVENKAEETQIKWLLENMRDILFESLTEKEIEEEPTRKGKEESSSEKEVEDEKMDKIKRKEEEEEEEEEEEKKKKEEKQEEEEKEEKEKKEEKQEEEEKEEKEKKEEKQEEEANLNKEKEKESIFRETVLSREDQVSKTELSVEGVSYLKLVKEGEILEEERGGTARREVPFKKETLLHGKRDPTFMDEPIWPTVLKSPFKIPLPAALEKKEGMPLKILGDQLDLEGQESQLGAYPMTSSGGRQEDVHLEKSRDMILQVIETGLETHSPKDLRGPGSHLPVIIKPRKPERRPKGGRWKWSLKYRDSSEGRTEGQAPAPAPVPAPAPAPSLTTMPAERPSYSEAIFSDEDWVNNALKRLEAGEQLSRDSFHRLSQLLRDFTSKGYLKWMHLSNLKAIAKHFRQNLEMSHTATPQPYKDILRPLHLKVIPPIRKKEKETWLEPFLIPEPVLPSATRTQTPQSLNWHPLAESYRKEQAEEQLSTAVQEIKHIHPIRKDDKSLALISQKDSWVMRGKGDSPKFHKAKKKPLLIRAPGLPSITKRIQVPMAINRHLLGEPYRSVRVQELFSALKEMETRHFYPVSRDIFTGAHASVDKQTLALLFQKDLRAFQDKGRLPKLPQLEKAKPNSKKKEEVPPWETFVALYHVLRMLQERYAEDSATWMEQFYQLMDLYQLKSPRVQRLLLELLQRKKLQPQETIYKKALKTKELVLGERLFCGLFCGSSHVPAGSLKFQDVVPLPGKNKVHTLQPVGIAKYGFLELAWKSLPQVNPYLVERLPNITTPAL